jgi:heterodisulfide reductase subunit A
MKASRFLSSGELVKDRRTAIVNSEICGDCQFCPVTCPYGAIDLVSWKEDHIVAQVDDKKCEGCGICTGTCPLNAIELRHARESQIMAQVRALIRSNRDKDPIVLAYCCSECGGTSIDSAGMASMEYPANVRVVKVPCTGILKIHHFLEALKLGADAVMVVGCKPSGCHYEEGSTRAARNVELAKVLLKSYGIEAERLEMFHNVYVEGNDFAKEATTMTRRAVDLGPLQRDMI